MSSKFLKLLVVVVSISGSIALPRFARASLPPILGGADVQASDPVAQISVAIYNEALGGLCTGSIIDTDLVVTAAHCLGDNASDLFVILNRDINQMQHSDLIMVKAQSRHSKYNPNESDSSVESFDIGLLRIDGVFPAPFHPAKRLPLKTKLQVGQDILLAGYGISKPDSEDPQGITAGVLRETAGVAVENPNFTPSEVLLDQTKGHGACHGDSGGPAYVVGAGGNLQLWGITSRGFPDDAPDDCKHSSIYTNINAHDQWLTDEAAKLRAIP